MANMGQQMPGQQMPGQQMPGQQMPGQQMLLPGQILAQQQMMQQVPLVWCLPRDQSISKHLQMQQQQQERALRAQPVPHEEYSTDTVIYKGGPPAAQPAAMTNR